MIKNLLSIAFLATSYLVVSQSMSSATIDSNGKVSFQKNDQNNSGNQNQNFLNPDELELDWSTPDVNLSDNPDFDTWDMRLTTQSNDVYVVYNDNHTNGLQKIIFRKKLDDDQWSDVMFVDDGGEIGARNNHLPAIAASSNGDLHVVYNVWAFENGRNYVGYSYFDAAADEWADGVKISDLGGTVDHVNGYKDVYSTENNLPVVVWGFDNRANSSNEEVYLTYFDGENWSEDLAVSDVTDNRNAGFPYIKSIGNQKAMILYSEFNSGGSMDLKYRIYDEATHELSDPQIINSENVNSVNYILVAAEDQILVLKYYKMPGQSRDAIELYNYDVDSDIFTLSPNVFEIEANAGGLMKRMDMDCNSNGDCGIIITDFMSQTISFMEYNQDAGFGESIVICNEDPQFDFPSIRFDDLGNVHAGWADMRNDSGSGWLMRDIIYKIGINELIMGTGDMNKSNVVLYPNPSNGTFTIQTDQVYLMEIFDMTGKLVALENISGTKKFQISVPAGVYLVKLSGESGTMVKKILIK